MFVPDGRVPPELGGVDVRDRKPLLLGQREEPAGQCLHAFVGRDRDAVADQ